MAMNETTALQQAKEFLKIYEEKYDDPLKSKQMEQQLEQIIMRGNMEELEEFNHLIESDIQWFPDETLGNGDMHKYGYYSDLMLPLSEERAKDLFLMGVNIFALYPDGTEAEIENIDQIGIHDGLFGIETDEWREYQLPANVQEDMEFTYIPMIPIDRTVALSMFESRFPIVGVDHTVFPPRITSKEEIQKGDIFQATESDYLLYVKGLRIMEERTEIQSMEEFRMIFANHDMYGIYQLKDGEFANKYRFMNYDFIQRQGEDIRREDYKLVYSGELYPSDTLDSLYEKFNIHHPEDYHAHSLSVSDIVVLQNDGRTKAYFVDSFGFQELEDFLLTREQLEERSRNAEIIEEEKERGSVGRIEYYGSDGIVGDSIEYDNEEKFLKELKEETNYGVPLGVVLYMDEKGKTISKKFLKELDPPPKSFLIEDKDGKVQEREANEMMKKEPHMEYYAAVCDEFHNLGEYYRSNDLDEIIREYKQIIDDPTKSYMGNGMGIIYCDPNDTLMDEWEWGVVRGTTVIGRDLELVDELVRVPMVREAIERIHEKLPDYEYIPLPELKEELYPEKMNTEELASALETFIQDADFYEYLDNHDPLEDTVERRAMDLRIGKAHEYIRFLKDLIDDEHPESARAEVLADRLREYVPDIPKDMEPVVMVRYSENEEIKKGRFYGIGELDQQIADMDKDLFNKVAQLPEGTEVVVKMYFTVYYPSEDQMKEIKGNIDIGEGNGGLVAKLKEQNEVKLTDESWLNFQRNKGEESFRTYMADLTDMQDHVLPYLQSFCSLEEKEPIKVTEQVTVNDHGAVKQVVKNVDDTVERENTEEKKSIHERLKINKEKIAEKKPEKEDKTKDNSLEK